MDSISIRQSTVPQPLRSQIQKSDTYYSSGERAFYEAYASKRRPHEERILGTLQRDFIRQHSCGIKQQLLSPRFGG